MASRPPQSRRVSRYALAALFIHHTPKTTFKDTDKFKFWEWMYWGAGCAGITNWARAVLIIKPVTEDMRGLSPRSGG